MRVDSFWTASIFAIALGFLAAPAFAENLNDFGPVEGGVPQAYHPGGDNVPELNAPNMQANTPGNTGHGERQGWHPDDPASLSGDNGRHRGHDRD